MTDIDDDSLAAIRYRTEACTARSGNKLQRTQGNTNASRAARDRRLLLVHLDATMRRVEHLERIREEILR